MAGPAITVEVVGGENGTIHRALESASEGSVLVVAAGGGLDRAIWGGVLARAAVARGVVGVVIDGAVRDVDDLVAIGLPTFAVGSTPLGPHKGWPGRAGLAIACAGVVVRPGDVVVGDGDGVAVVPADQIDETYRMATARLANEEEWLRRIALGESTVEILGLESDQV
jgi:4-hydroxy-4-methyl-2-oxoglutarate aldolase